MGDDVEIEEIFDADLLSGSEDDEEGAHQEEALLGVDAVCRQIDIFIIMSAVFLNLLENYFTDNYQFPGLCKSWW